MKRTSSAKRVPRKIGGDQDDSGPPVAGANQETSESVVVKRPNLPSKGSSKSRLSFGPIAVDDSEDGSPLQNTSSPIRTTALPRRAAGLSRLAIERNATRQQDSAGESPLRPSYSATDLAELKSRTQATPVGPTTLDQSELNSDRADRALDVASKFGPLAVARDQQESAAIPSAAEIQEKKDRRARLALEAKAAEMEVSGDYISLSENQGTYNDFAARQPRRRYADEDEDEDRLTSRASKTHGLSESSRSLIKPIKPDYLAETRLIREDEDMAEGFDTYTEDTPLAIGRKAEKQARKAKRAEIAAAIAAAEGRGATVVMDEEGGIVQDSAAAAAEESDSEAERNAAFEAKQRRAAGATVNAPNGSSTRRSHIPIKLTPIPTLPNILTRLRTQLSTLQSKEQASRTKLTQLALEKKEIAEREEWIQSQLKEVGERYEKLRAEAGMPPAAAAEGGVVGGVRGVEGVANGGRLLLTGLLNQERGLESIGNTPVATRDEDSGFI